MMINSAWSETGSTVCTDIATGRVCDLPDH